MAVTVQGGDNIPTPDAVKYRFSKHHNCWVRTWFTIEDEEETKTQYFKQHVAFSKDRNTDWNKWTIKPVGAP